MALVDEVVETHGLAGSDIVVTGISMGGYGTWHLATRYPDRISRAASVSGSGYGTTQLPPELDVCALAGVDLRAYHGESDMISLLDLNLSVIESWEERCATPVSLEVLSGEGHLTTLDEVYGSPEFYDWLLG